MKQLFNVLLLVLFALSIYSCKKKNELPSYTQFPSEALRDPLQNPTTRSPFDAQINNQTHHVVPQFDYQISGLVVSSGFSKNMAKRRNDDLNLMDVGLLWGSNLNPEIYQKITFKNNGVWLHANAKDCRVWKQLDQNRLSNSHLICTNPALRKQLKALHPGEIISIEGCLANYSGRNSSTVRTDRRGGACEIIWVDQLVILQDKTKPWALLSTISLYSLLALLFLKIVCFFVL